MSPRSASLRGDLQCVWTLWGVYCMTKAKQAMHSDKGQGKHIHKTDPCVQAARCKKYICSLQGVWHAHYADPLCRPNSSYILDALC